MKKIILILILLFIPSTTFADTHNAADCSASGIGAAIYAAADGDTVSVPTGTCTYAAISPTSIDVSGGLCRVHLNGHGLETGTYVHVLATPGMGGCGAASTSTPHMITVLDENTFTLDNPSSPSGTCSSGCSLLPVITLKDKSVSVIGGSGGTTTLNGLPYVNLIMTGNGKTLRFSGFTITSSTSDVDNGMIRISGTTGTSRFRFDNNIVTPVGTRRAGIVKKGYGSIDNNTFTGTYQKWGVYSNEGVRGDTSWTEATELGSDKFVVFENNTFTNTYTGKAWAAMDCQYGGRYVARYNNFVNHTALSHGAMGVSTSYEGRACRVSEVYNNTFTCEPGNTCYAWTEVFGGRSLIYNNVSIGNWSLGWNLMVQRVSDADGKGSPWLACDGTHAWDGSGTAPEAGYPCHDQTGVGPDTGNPNTTPQTVTEPAYFWNNTGSKTNIWAQSAHLTLNRDYCTHDTSTTCGGVDDSGYSALSCPSVLVTELSGTSCDTTKAGAGLTGGYGVSGGTTYYDLTVDSITNGTVTSDHINCPGTCVYNYESGDSDTFSYSPNSGWGSGTWGGTCGCSGSAGTPCAVTVSSACDISVTEATLKVMPWIIP